MSILLVRDRRRRRVAALLYLAYRIEPHWVAKDGSRFLTTSETIDHEGKVVSRRREVRGTIMTTTALIMLGKRSMLRTRSQPLADRRQVAASSSGVACCTSSTPCRPTRWASS